MSLLTFIAINAAFIAIDGGVSFAILGATGISVVYARLISCTIALVMLGFFIARMAPEKGSSDGPGRTLAIIVSALSTGLSFGLFTLILDRNPIVQWPVAFTAGSFASLIFASLAYWRAQRR